jgi:putative ABC transport system ATP-binding protein
MNIIELRGIKKDYALGQTTVHAVRGVDLDVEKGELMTIMGPSGSGKTTLLNIIGAIDSPTEGSVSLAGEAISALSDAKITDIRLHRIGFIFQTFNLIPVLDAVENVEFPLLLMKKFSKAEVRHKAEALIDRVGITEFKKHRPAELSGGQRQRVAIARALVTHPALVLADEPTANLDSVTGAQILELMQQMNRAEETTFLFSTHDANVLKYARRVVKIKDGLIEDKG